SKRELFNKEKASQMVDGEERIVKVSVNLEHEDTLYTVVREQTCKKSETYVSLIGQPRLKMFYKSIYNTTDGQTHQVKPIDVEDTVQEILPEDLSGYFFYDTEK